MTSWTSSLIAVAAAVCLTAGCGWDSTAAEEDDYPPTEAGLTAYIDDVLAASVIGDVEALWALQPDHCDSTLAEAEEAWRDAQAATELLAGGDVTLADLFRHTEATVTAFEPGRTVTTVRFSAAESASGLVAEILAQPQPPVEYEHRDGRWHSADPAECLGDRTGQ